MSLCDITKGFLHYRLQFSSLEKFPEVLIRLDPIFFYTQLEPICVIELTTLISGVILLLF